MKDYCICCKNKCSCKSYNPCCKKDDICNFKALFCVGSILLLLYVFLFEYLDIIFIIEQH